MNYIKFFESVNFRELEDKINAYARAIKDEIVSVSMIGMWAAVVFKECDTK